MNIIYKNINKYEWIFGKKYKRHLMYLYTDAFSGSKLQEYNFIFTKIRIDNKTSVETFAVFFKL